MPTLFSFIWWLDRGSCLRSTTLEARMLPIATLKWSLRNWSSNPNNTYIRFSAAIHVWRNRFNYNYYPVTEFKMELLHLVSIGLFVLLPVVADADTFKGIKSTIASVENSLAGVRSRLSSLENKLKSKYSIFYHNFISSQSSSILM